LEYNLKNEKVDKIIILYHKIKWT